MLAIISTNCISSTQTIVNTMLQRFINAKVIIHVFTIFFFFIIVDVRVSLRASCVSPTLPMSYVIGRIKVNF
jgi:hypothetical protein